MLHPPRQADEETKANPVAETRNRCPFWSERYSSIVACLHFLFNAAVGSGTVLSAI